MLAGLRFRGECFSCSFQFFEFRGLRFSVFVVVVYKLKAILSFEKPLTFPSSCPSSLIFRAREGRLSPHAACLQSFHCSALSATWKNSQFLRMCDWIVLTQRIQGNLLVSRLIALILSPKFPFPLRWHDNGDWAVDIFGAINVLPITLSINPLI